MSEDTTLPDGGDAPEAPAGETTLHDDVARAFEQIESRDAPPEPGAPTQQPQPLVEGQPPAQVGERARGPDGRFLPATETPPAGAGKVAAAPAAPGATNGSKPPAAPVQKPQGAADAPKLDPAAPPPPLARPPASWKPQAREHWAKLPAEVQQEVTRRETEVARSLQESARSRDALAHVQQVVGPFAANIGATGGDALTFMGNLFRADNTLRHGSVSEKAAMVADIIKSYGVDLTTLDSVLAGQPAPNDPNTQLADRLRREMQAQLQPVMNFVNTMQGRQQHAMQQINTDATSEVQAFAQDPAHEFYEDVRTDMADIIDLYTQRGASISLQDAYERAIKLNPQVSEIIAKRAEQQRASAAAAAAQRAKRTAASITSAPAPAGAGPGPAGDDRRAQIEAAWNDSQGS